MNNQMPYNYTPPFNEECNCNKNIKQLSERIENLERKVKLLDRKISMLEQQYNYSNIGAIPYNQNFPNNYMM